MGLAAAIGRTHGGGTWKVDRSEPVNPQVGSRRAFLQRFVEQDAEHQSDVRVYVVGDRVVGAMYRHAPAGEWRTNVALGGEVEDATDDLPDAVFDIARRCAESQIALMAVVALLVVAGTAGVSAATPGTLGVASTTDDVPELPEPDSVNSTDSASDDDGVRNESESVPFLDARDAARSTLSAPEDGQWRLVESDLHEDDGYYEFEYLLGGTDTPGEAEVRVDVTSGDVFRLEQEIEYDDGDDEYEMEIEGLEQEDKPKTTMKLKPPRTKTTKSRSRTDRRRRTDQRSRELTNTPPSIPASVG
jgi:hypothetical protein